LLKADTMHRALHVIIAAILLLGSRDSRAQEGRVRDLDSLALASDEIKSLRAEISASLAIIKGNRDEKEMPSLRFLRYTVKKGDSFWTILSATSQNIDTIISINSITSPQDMDPGKELYIPNMRGIAYQVRSGDTLASISRATGVREKYIARCNRVKTAETRYLFIPCASISSTERALFLGTAFANPLQDSLKTSGFGMRRDPFNNVLDFHRGIDLACPVNTTVGASRAGKIVYAGFYGGYGLLVIIQHAYDYYSYYGHLNRVLAPVGAEVAAGEAIALSGNSGRTTGPHLHFEVRKGPRPVNPGLLLENH
jgi:murein DD-endopeptidase MepM/ murein hydrolase activator NlpD